MEYHKERAIIYLKNVVRCLKCGQHEPEGCLCKIVGPTIVRSNKIYL